MNLYATCCESAASSLAVTQYPPIAPNRNQVVKLLPQPGHLLGRTQIMPGGTQNQIHKSKQPQQILPKPIPPGTSPQKQSVPRLNTAMPQQTPLLINQPQTQTPALLLNQVLTSGGPVLVQPAGPGGTVHLMLRTPTPSLQSGPGPPQNKMIIANTTQPQPQATVLIQNRQQVVRFMTAQGPMQLQQIQTPSGPQLIAIPQNQSLSFPTNSVLVQGPATNALQLQQNSGNPLQIGQNPSAIIQSANSFPQSSLPSQIPIQNQIFSATTTTSPAAVGSLKRDDKSNSIENPVSLTGSSDHKKIVIDNKITGNNNNFNGGSGSNGCGANANLNSGSNIVANSLGNGKKNNKGGKGKSEEDSSNRNANKSFGKTDNLIGPPVSAPVATAQKNITSSLRQIRPGSLANRNKQNQSAETKEDVNSKSLSNLTRIIDSVASNTEHLISPPPKVDNLTATINSVAENIKSPTPDDIMSKLSLGEVFATGSKSLNLNRRPNLTIVQKQSNRIVQPEADDSGMAINRLIVTPNSGVDFENVTGIADSLELTGGLGNSGGARTQLESQGFEQHNASNQGIFHVQDHEGKKGKKKACGKKKGKKEENRVDLWDLMKSAGIGDDEFDEPSDVAAFPQDAAAATAAAAAAVAEPLEISASDTDLLAQFQSASQLPAGIRVVVGEDGRPVIINGGNVLIPENIQNASSSGAGAESSDAEAVLQNMILPDSVFNFTPQAFATAQTQLNQLIQDHGGLATSSADQQLLSQIFGTTPSGVASNGAGIGANANPSVLHSTPSSSAAMTNVQNVQALTSSSGQENVLVGMSPNAVSTTATTNSSSNSNSSSNNEIVQGSNLIQKQEPKPEYTGEPPPGLPPLGPDSLVITNNNGVPTLVASPALMQYLQTHQGIIQFQHDPVTKTIQPSLIIPHPQPKVESVQQQQQQQQNSAQEPRIGKMASVVPSSSNNNNNNSNNNSRALINQTQDLKSRTEVKAIVETTTAEEQKTGSNNIVGAATNSDPVNPNVVKLNAVKFVKDNSSLLQLATETNNLIGYRERNAKNLSEKDLSEIEKKIQQNRAILDQCLLMENNRGGVTQVGSATVQNVTVKEGGGVGASGSKAGVSYQVETAEKIFAVTSKTTETAKTLEDLQNLDATLAKSFHPTPNTNSPTPNSDFQSKFLESIGMANKTSQQKVTVSIGTGTGSTTPATSQSPSVQQPLAGKRGRKKKEKIQSQATQADGKTEVACLTFNIADLTPEQNVRLNQALQNRGAIVNQIENLDAIKQMIHEEVRKITSNSVDSASIRFTTSGGLPIDDQDRLPECSLTAANVVLGNPNLSQILENPPGNPGNVISLQGNELIAINGGGNQQIFASQNPVLSGNHFVSSNNQILAIGGSHNQLVSLGNPINSSNQIVTLGNPPNLMSVGGNNVAGPGAVIVGGNGNVVAIVHQNAPSGQNSGLVQRIQTIQLTTPKQQHFKTVQSQIQTLSSKSNRTQTEQATLQKLILEQQKILSTGKLVQTFPGGQQVHGMQIVSQSIQNANRLYQSQTTSQQHHHHQQQQQSHQPQSQLSQTLSQVHQSSQSLQQSQSLTFITNNSNSQSGKTNFTSQTVVSCGTNTSEFSSSFQPNIPKMTVPPTVLISDVPTSNYGPLYVNPNASGKNVTKCEKGTSPIQIQMGTQTVTNMEYRSGKMSTGTMTSPNTGKPQAVVAPAIVIQQTENQSPTSYQLKPRNQAANASEPVRTTVPALSRTAFIEQQMRTDQAGATMPDTRTPFSSKSDACKRLIRYHVMDEKCLSRQDLSTADDIFEATAQHLLDKFRMMKEKYKYLLMLESMREVSTAERIMVDRNFIIEERMELEELREKEKRLQEEFENPSIVYRNADASAVKTEFALDDVRGEGNDLTGSDHAKGEAGEKEDKYNGGIVISKKKTISDINSDSVKDNSFKLTEANRDEDLVKIKSETKECKNTRTPDVESPFSPDESLAGSGNGKSRAKNGRTFSDGSSKSSLEGSRDEDSGADINAQVQSAIDSILNLQKCDIMSEAGDETVSPSGKRSKKGKRKFVADKSQENSKRSKVKRVEGGKRREKNGSDEEEEEGEEEEEEDDDDDGGRGRGDVEADGEEEDEDGGGSDADPILDEAIRSILTS